MGFKWFVDGLVDGSVGFGGEESAGASFLRRDGSVWTTDKDGIIACLLAAEVTAKAGRNPAELYAGLTERFGAPAYRRIDAPATPEVKAALGRLAPEDVTATTLGGDPITARLTHAPGQRRARSAGSRSRRTQALVRRPPVGHGERDQAVRGVVPRRGAPGAGARGGGRDRRRGGGAPPGAEPGRATPRRSPAPADDRRDLGAEQLDRAHQLGVGHPAADHLEQEPLVAEQLVLPQDLLGDLGRAADEVRAA